MSRSNFPISSPVDPIGYFIMLFDSKYLDDRENYFYLMMDNTEELEEGSEFNYEHLTYTITKDGDSKTLSYNDYMKEEWEEEFNNSKKFISNYINTSLVAYSKIHSNILIQQIEFVNQMTERLDPNLYSNFIKLVNELKTLIHNKSTIAKDDNISNLYNFPFKVPKEKISSEGLPRLLKELFELESGETNPIMFIANFKDREKAISTINQLQDSSFDPQSLPKFNVNWRKEPTCYVIKKLAETTFFKIKDLSENQLCQIDNTPIGNSNTISKNASEFKKASSQLKQTIDDLFSKYLYS